MGDPYTQIALAAYSIFQGKKADEAQVDELQIAKGAEKTRARGLEIESRRRLVDALANQNAVRGAQGIQVGQGSVAAISAADARRAATERAQIRSNSLARLAQLSTRQRFVRRQGQVNIATSLFAVASSFRNRGTIAPTVTAGRAGSTSPAPKITAAVPA